MKDFKQMILDDAIRAYNSGCMSTIEMILDFIENISDKDLTRENIIDLLNKVKLQINKRST